MKNINDQLKELYSKKWEKLSSELNEMVQSDDFEIKPGNPLILSLWNPNQYKTSDVKIMILGQENNGWEGIFNGNLESGLDVCSSFYRGEYYAHRGFFHNHFNLIVNLLKANFVNKKLGIVWSNVIKVGKANDKNIPPEYIVNSTLQNFNVLQDELDILTPDIILFLSGPDYDVYINKQIENVEFSSFKNYDRRKVSKVNIPNIPMAFRTYHPNSMHFLGKPEYTKIYSDIMHEIKRLRK